MRYADDATLLAASEDETIELLKRIETARKNNNFNKYDKKISTAITININSIKTVESIVCMYVVVFGLLKLGSDKADKCVNCN